MGIEEELVEAIDKAYERMKWYFVCDKMDETLCKKAKRIIQDVASDIMIIEDYSYYLWLHRIDGEMVGIVHGGIGKPFEFKVINVGEFKTKDFNFDDWNSFENFLRNDMRNEILAMAI